jgi:uncharacterized protein involved in exopolysaccharide biosynthesis
VSFSERRDRDDGHEISVVAVLRVALAHKKIVAVTTLIVTALAAVIGITATPIFQADVIVTLTRDPTFGGVGSAGGQLGGLASLAGVSLGVSDQDRERQAILESRHLMEEFIKRNSLLPVLFAGAKTSPTMWSGVERFRRGVLEINEDKIKETTTVSIDWPDPKVAAQWANAYVALANDLVRARALDDATKSIEYLKTQIARTDMVELQRLMYDLIESQTKTLMLANARAEYAFTVVDPAVAPEIRISPKRKLIVAAGIALGLLLGSIVAVIYDRFRPHGAESRRESSHP